MATISDRPHRKARAVSEGKRSLTRPSFSRPPSLPSQSKCSPRQNLNLPFNYSRVTPIRGQTYAKRRESRGSDPLGWKICPLREGTQKRLRNVVARSAR